MSDLACQSKCCPADGGKRASSRWLTIAPGLVVLTILYNLAEAGFSLYFGWDKQSNALLMIPWLLKEGAAGIKGEGCCG